MPDLLSVPFLAPARRPDLLLKPLGDRGDHVVKDPRTGDYYNLGVQESFLLLQLDGRRGRAAICAAFTTRFGERLSQEELQEFIDLADRWRLLLPAEAVPVAVPVAAPVAPEPRPRVPGSFAVTVFTPFVGPEAVRPATPGGAAAKRPPAVAEPAPPPARPRQSILYWRKRVFDPDRLLTWLTPGLGFVWTRAFLLVSAGCIVLAAILVWANRQDLVSCFANAWRWETAVLVWLTLIVTTTLHEFAHGLTCKHHGGEVHEIGFLLMFFLPCFYCNVSDAWLIREKSKRLWVTLAGGYCDLCLWAVAVFVWRLSPLDALANYLAWVVLSVLGARVFFNFNPLLKLDGYYLLSDWLEVHNLRQRSWERVAGWVRCLLWGAPRPAGAPRCRFLLAYGLVSWLFSLVFLVVMLTGFYRFLGANWGIAGGGLAVLLGVATLPGMFQGFAGGEVRKMILMRHKRVVAWFLAAGALAAGLIFGRMEDRVGGPFEVVPTTRAEVRAPVAGFLREVFYDEGEQVYSGAPVARLEVPDLDSQLAQKRAAVREAAARLRLLQAGPRPEEVAEQRGRVKRAQVWRDLAEQDLARARDALREELAALDEQITQCRAEQTYLEEVLKQSSKLVGQQAVSRREYQEAEKQLQVAHSKEQQARALKRARTLVGTRESEAELARRDKELADAQGALRLLEAGTRREEVEAEQARLGRLREEVLYLEEVGGKLQVCSPVHGLISTPRLKEKIGRYVREGDLLCEVEEPSRLEVEVALAEADAARVSPGQWVELKSRAHPFQTFEAQVERLAPRAVRAEPGTAALQPARGELPSTVTVYCRLEGTATGLRPGMTGHARISCGQRSPGALLGDRALRLLRTEFWW